MSGSVEGPPHVHPTRMRDIGSDDLLRGIGHEGSSIASVRAIIAERGRSHPPVWDPRDRVAPTGGWATTRDHVAEAEELLDRRVDFLGGHSGRSGLYGLHYLNWLDPLVLAYIDDGDPRYAECFARFFDAWFASRNAVVGQWPGLDVVWYSLGVWARARTLVPALHAFAGEPVVPDQTVESALATLLGGARWAVEEHATYRPGNWQLVCSAELLHVASFLHQAPERDDWVHVGLARLGEHLRQGFRDDGGHLERSPGYHALCLEELQRAAVVAERDHSTDLASHPTFARAHQWLADMSTPGGWVPPWQDSALVWPEQLLARGRNLWGEDLVAPTKARDSILTSSGYVVMRGMAPSAPFCAMNVGEHVGHELESHSHQAVGDFVISAYGEALAVEAGGPPSYDDPLYQSWYRSPASHCMLTLDGRALREDRAVEFVYTSITPSMRRVRVAHDGFDDTVIRELTFVDADPCYWLVVDELADDLPWTWTLLSPAPWVQVAEGFRASGMATLTVVPASCEVDVEFDSGPGLIPGEGTARYGTLHALRLRGTSRRVEILVAPGWRDDGAAWSIQGGGGAWRVSDGHFVDVVSRDALVRTNRTSTT